MQALDIEGAGHLTVEQLTKFMSEDGVFALRLSAKEPQLIHSSIFHPRPQTGEPFTAEELEEMLAAAVDPEKKVVFYEDHATLMALEVES
eukprot:m.120625 g.120625  ORF g.120625 m.120625 type:complete len:90 (-) comp9583_c0_seq1:163-432(-)